MASPHEVIGLLELNAELLKALRRLADEADSFEDNRDNNNAILEAIDAARDVIVKAECR